MRRLIFTFVVRIWHKTHFRMTWPSHTVRTGYKLVSKSVKKLNKKIHDSIFSSPEPSGSQGELIVYSYSGVRCRRRCRRRRRRCHRRRRQQCLNIFSSETALPIKAKFYVEPPWEGGTKVYINGPGHMTKMAAMPIYGKNL